MVNAVHSGITDGVGLGRPITAEPDLPAKILRGIVHGALNSVFEGDYALGNMAANTQMSQAGSTTIAEARYDPCFGVMDISTEEGTRLYKQELMKHIHMLEEAGKAGRLVSLVLEFVPVVSKL
jgi:hypothetical protein